jgi:hypothetical protein
MEGEREATDDGAMTLPQTAPKLTSTAAGPLHV